MFIITCPHCGDRDVIEFSYGGDATKRYPDDPAQATEADWHAHVYERDNPRGWHVEWWQHSLGCRQWLKLRRNTLTHALGETALPDAPLTPEGPEGSGA